MPTSNAKNWINLEDLAGGEFAIKINEALLQVAENIKNTNTSATARRSISVTLKFDPDNDRQLIRTSVSVQTKLAAAESIELKMVMNVDEYGEIELKEYDGQISGQMSFDDQRPAASNNYFIHKTGTG